MSEQQSIKDTLDVIRKALEDDESSLEEIKDNVLILNKLVVLYLKYFYLLLILILY